MHDHGNGGARLTANAGARREGLGASGFSLVELIVTLAMLTITGALAMPMYQNLSAQNEVVAVTNQLQASLQTARLMAVTRNIVTSFCAGNAEEGCHRDWSREEWMVFIDQNRDGELDTDDIVLEVQQSNARHVKIAVNGPFRLAVLYRADGSARSRTGALALGRIRICAEWLIEPIGRDLVLIGSGRAEPQPYRNADGECPAP